MLSRLADYFEVSVDYLLGRTKKDQFYHSQQKQGKMVKENQTNYCAQDNEVPNRDDLAKLVQQAESLPPKAIQALIEFIQTMEEE